MANSVLPVEYEKQLQWFCYNTNKLKRRGLLTDVLVAAVTSVADLIADVYAGLNVSGTSNAKYGPEVRILVEFWEQGVHLIEQLGLIDDTIAAALTTVNTASAATDLRFLASNVVTLNGFDPAAEPMIDGVFAGSVSA